MFLDQNTGREGFECIGVEDRDGSLEQNRAAIEIFVDEVDGTSSDLHSMGERLILRIEAGESGQKRGMYVEDTAGKLRNEVSAQKTHISRETNPIYAVLPK